MTHRLGRLPERLRAWRYGRQIRELCMAYGGKMGDGETRVCGKWRGHLDSHAYDRIDAVLRPRGWCERDGVLVRTGQHCGGGPDLDWVAERFPDRCYFYPGRDCPGWAAGDVCSRVGNQVPAGASRT